MKIKWNGHASFTITAQSGAVVVTDPYEPGGYNGAIAYGPVDDKADVVIVSHEHPDHSHIQGVPGSPKVLKQGGDAAGISFSGIETAHDDKGGSERGKNMAYAFEVDGVRVVFLGDLGHVLSGEQAKALGKVDVLFCPVGGFFTIDAGAAEKVADQLQPKVIIPMHFKTEKCKFPIATADDFAKRMTRVKKLGQSEISVTAQSLPAAGPEVWIMEYAR